MLSQFHFLVEPQLTEKCLEEIFVHPHSQQQHSPEPNGGGSSSVYLWKSGSIKYDIQMK